MPTLKECRSFINEYAKMTWQARLSTLVACCFCMAATWAICAALYSHEISSLQADNQGLRDEIQHPVNFAAALKKSSSSPCTKIISVAPTGKIGNIDISDSTVPACAEWLEDAGSVNSFKVRNMRYNDN